MDIIELFHTSLSLSIPTSMYMFIHLSICENVHLFIYSLTTSTYMYVYLTIYQYVHPSSFVFKFIDLLYIYLSIYQYVHLSFYLFIHVHCSLLSISTAMYMFIDLSIICPSFFLFIKVLDVHYLSKYQYVQVHPSISFKYKA